ncbi:unnamed protein product [Candidula unifasciata]|uniref:Angiotensin-converting enzyme n=1 Tax=Candidula unifasciata TaxID=100452 RepID=A0A8S3YI01_9EUPU|nr:unnamed protein product [Candidula unifasciata]
MKIWAFLITLSFLGHVTSQGTNDNQTEAEEFLESFNSAAGKQQNILSQKQWNLDTNITDFNEEQLVKQQSIAAQFDKDMRAEALQFNSSAMSADVQRQLGKITDIGTSAQPNATKVEELATVLAEMQSIYGKAKVCLTPDICLPLEPDITRFLAQSRDYDTLETLWVGWRNETGRKMKDLYTKFVQLSNEAVQYLGYQDTGEEWRSAYESDTFVADVQDLFDQLRPLYEQLHAYVRRRLRQVYGESRFPASGHIPAHLLGNMWAQEWGNVVELVKPFANKTSMDVTPEMVRQKYTVDKIFRTAEDFFVSLGFDKMVPSFWTLSMLEKPNDGREVVCHASAWDFYNQKDFRIKMCTDITQDDLMTVHHEMGHVAYFMQYKNQPVIYRDGANPGNHCMHID